MSLIGVFTPTENGFNGRIQTLIINAAVCMTRVTDKNSKNVPDYLINLGDDASGAIIGAGWIRRAEQERSYIAVQIDDPAISLPIKANLLLADAKKSIHHLYWSRQSDIAKL